MPKVTKNQSENIKVLRSRGVKNVQIYTRAGVNEKTFYNFMGAGASEENCQKIAQAIADLLRETDVAVTSDRAAKLDRERLDWITAGSKGEGDFWSIGREVEQLWMQAEEKLKSLPEDEADLLRTMIKRRMPV